AAAKSGYQSVAYVQALEEGGAGLEATSLILGGKMLARVALRTPSVLQVLSGMGDAARGRGGGVLREVVEFSASPAGRVSFEGFELPEVSDVDITKAQVLVSVGRGIGDRDNIGLAEELAEALGGVLSSSRPIVDAGWLPKARQVGKSGNRVKPKVYLALGISGAPE
ncbi:Electron transfer flavoprotein alpha subunit, partial [mine drainage metagenome]